MGENSKQELTMGARLRKGFQNIHLGQGQQKGEHSSKGDADDVCMNGANKIDEKDSPMTPQQLGDAGNVCINGGNKIDKRDSPMTPQQPDLLMSYVINNSDLVNRLCALLDGPRNSVVKNWQEIAAIMGLERSKILHLENSIPSPTEKLLDFLKVSRPLLTVKDFKDMLKEMRRNDVVKLLDTDFAVPEGQLVGDATENLDLKDRLKVLLDMRSLGMTSWKRLAVTCGVRPEIILKMEKDTPSPTRQLLTYLTGLNPTLTVREFMDVLKRIRRLDVVERLACLVVLEEQLVRVVTENQDLMDELEVLLDTRSPVLGNWKDVAFAFGVEREIILNMEPHEIRSPTTRLLEFLRVSHPSLTVAQFIDALKRIHRFDVVKDLVKYLDNLKVSDEETFIDLQRMEQSTEVCREPLLSEMERRAINRGFKVYNNSGSGNCMFYALSEQLERVKGVRISHEKVRKILVQFLKENPTLPDGTKLFNFVSGFSSWAAYLSSMGKNGTWGDHVILDAAANCFETKIHVISLLLDRDVFINPRRHVSDTKPLVLGHIQELHYVSLVPQNVPPEVLAGGPLDWEAYREASVGEGTIPVMQVPLMVIGQYGSGKTSLIKSLKGEKFNPSQDVTDRIEKDPSLFRLSKENLSLGEKPESDFAICDNRMGGDVASLMRNRENEEPSKDGEDISAVVWDFGGQSVFYDTHPIFLTPKAIYLLVHNLKWNPEDRASPVLRQRLYENKPKRDEDCIKTNADYLDLWLSSVSSLTAFEKEPEEALPERFKGKLPEKLPPVIFVCTHADCPYDSSADPKDIAREVYGSLKGKYFSSHLFQEFFAVNNTKSGSEEECPEVQRLKREICSVAHQLPHVKKDIPIKWFEFENELLARKEQGQRCISIDEAREIADKLEINGDKRKRVLNFLHEQRSVIHFQDSKVLSNLVILDVEWLIDVFKRVITVKKYQGMSQEEERLWVKLQDKGILADELLRIVWDDLQDGESSESLIALMAKFGLLFPCPLSECGKEYFVPSILMSHPADTWGTMLHTKIDLPSLFLRFKNLRSGKCPSSVPGEVQYVPVPLGFFTRFVLKFLEWCTERQIQPLYPKYKDYANICVYPNEGYSVVLRQCFSFIELVVLRENHNLRINPSEEDVCSSLRRKLEDMLSSMQEDFCWMRNVQFELSMLCPVCCKGGFFTECSDHPHCKREECLHFWSEAEVSECGHPRCERTHSPCSKEFSSKMFKPWFKVSEAKEDDICESVLSLEDSLLSDIVGNVNVLDELSRQLDRPTCHGKRETTAVKYWLHLAEEFRVPRDTQIECQHSFENSPSKYLFEIKESRHPYFTVQNLKDGLRDIPRNDLVERLEGCELPDSATLGALRKELPETFKVICLQLDHHRNWLDLGKKIGISNEKLQQIKTSSSCSQTVLDIMEKRNPYVTVKEMRHVLSVEMERQDVCKELDKYPELSEDSTIADLRNNLDCLEKIAIKLDQETPGLKNWFYFGWKFHISTKDLNNLTPRRNPSPTKNMIEYVVHAEPQLTMKSLIQKLTIIERLDVVAALKEIICGNVFFKE